MMFFPDDYISSIYKVDFDALRQKGFRVALFDIDNTLVPHNAPADDRARELFRGLDSIGIKCYFLSNNKEPRVKTFCEAVKGTGYIYKAGKPKTTAYLKAVSLSGFSPEQAIFFGDQIFTDVCGAKRAGIKSILVKPVKKWHEEIQIILKRIIEAPIILFYKIKTFFINPKFRVPEKMEG